MSEIKDSAVYQFYDYVKSIYIYSHVKTHLKDFQRQPIEVATNYILLIFSIIFIFFSVFKVFVIIFYFIFIQAFTGFIKFLISICKTKFRLNFCSSLKNSIYYLGKVFKRIYTFNFYLFQNRIIGFIMIFSYFFFLFSSTFFYLQNIKFIDEVEKPDIYLISFYSHFESVILMQLLCSCFYSCRNQILSTTLAFGLFLSMNGMLFLGFFITDIIENVDGSFELEEPQAVMNIVFDIIFLFVNGISLFKIIIYKKESKYFY